MRAGDLSVAVDAAAGLLGSLQGMGHDAPIVLLNSGFIAITSSLMAREPGDVALHRILCECMVGVPFFKLMTCALLLARYLQRYVPLFEYFHSDWLICLVVGPCTLICFALGQCRPTARVVRSSCLSAGPAGTHSVRPVITLFRVFQSFLFILSLIICHR